MKRFLLLTALASLPFLGGCTDQYGVRHDWMCGPPHVTGAPQGEPSTLGSNGSNN